MEKKEHTQISTRQKKKYPVPPCLTSNLSCLDFESNNTFLNYWIEEF
jgi:hypothetical protein